jgi:cyclopropane fatty-acyl-phospholipid synthase-like methyltransferase
MDPDKPRLLTTKDVDYVVGRYTKRIREEGVTFRSMNSGSPERQALRHSVHFETISQTDSILDFGCGIGNFYEYITARSFEGSYTGVDAVPDYIQHCRKHFSRGRFELANSLDVSIAEEHDVIVASQVFNARYPVADNLAVMFDFLDHAFEKSRRAVSVDMLSSYVDFTEEHLCYYSPEAVFQHAKQLTRYVRLRHDYLPFEFTIQLFK